MVDDVAPAFRSIMEENKKLMYESRLVEDEQMKSIYRRETKIDDRLREFLKYVILSLSNCVYLSLGLLLHGIFSY